MSKSIDEQFRAIKRGAVEVVSEGELLRKLEKSLFSKKPLRIKAGFDPSAPDLHLGHAVLLRKLRDFQDCGHHVIFLIGDFTARIGDPTGKNEMRKPLSDADIKRNTRTYQRQVFRILDRRKTEVVYNNKWLSKLTPSDFLQLTSTTTVADMLARADFKQRYESHKPISIVEFLYPLFQAYDSVVLKSDVELGGTDQIFNLIMGRALQESRGQEPQVLLTMPILEGLDGVQKMSKSLGNYIALENGKDDMERAYNIFAPLMSISDELMFRYYELLTRRSNEEIGEDRVKMRDGALHPKECKETLAFDITEQFYGKLLAQECRERFEARHGKTSRGCADAKKYDDFYLDGKELTGGQIWICKLIRMLGGAATNSEARRLVQQGAVMIDNKKCLDAKQNLRVDYGLSIHLKVGKHQFFRIHLR
jgi:tyrosyl-tRNA synthetase